MIAGARVVALPGSEVAHLYVGPSSPAGRFVPGKQRPVCGASTTRRYGVVTNAAGLRPCRRCGALWIDTSAPPTRSAIAVRHADLTTVDLTLAARFATTLDAVERVQVVAYIVIGLPALNGGAALVKTERGTLLDLLAQRRERLRLDARTDDEVADDIAERQAREAQSAQSIRSYNEEWSELRRRSREQYRDLSAVTGGRFRRPA